MAQKETQIKYNPGDGDPNCAHPNLEYSELKKKAEERRREDLEQERSRAVKAAQKKLRAAQKFERLGNAAAAADCMKKFQGHQGNADGKAFEQKVAEEENAQWTSINFHCPDCGLSGDLDVVTENGVVKECKYSAKVASESQFNKNKVAAALIFGAATVVHMAVPPDQAAAVRRKFEQNMKEGKVQKH